MSFTPYHLFKNEYKLNNLVKLYIDNDDISTDAKNGHARYHPAIMHKLKSSHYYIEMLEQELDTIDAIKFAEAPLEVMFQVNMFMDGFFYASGSVLDILAREIIIYFGQSLPTRVYFETAREILTRLHPGDPFLSRLTEPSWRNEFKNYRNALTHELIVITKLTGEVDIFGDSPKFKLSIPLPDDPRAEPDNRTYVRNENVLEYIKLHFKRILILVNVIYGDLKTRIENNGSIPI